MGSAAVEVAARIGRVRYVELFFRDKLQRRKEGKAGVGGIRVS